jgi:hypothetical protein
MKGCDVDRLSPEKTGHYTSDSSSCSLAKSYKEILPKYINAFLRKSVNCPRKL